MAFDHVVSLGAWCQTTFQISNHALPLLPSCFDWLVTPWHSMRKIFETEGRDFGLASTVDFEAQSAICSAYGVLYHHEFRRDDGDLPIIDEESLVNVRSKLQHKFNRMDRTLKTAEYKTALFVRYGATANPARAWPYLADEAPFSATELNDLMEMLKKRYPTVNSRLLFLWPTPFAKLELAGEDLHPDIYAAPLPPPTAGKASWEGEAAPWKSVFNEAFAHWGAGITVETLGLDTTRLSH